MPQSRESHLLPSAVEAIGSTPLVEFQRISAGLDGRILAKLDFLNPGLSKKDRIARRIIEEAEARGDLQPGQTVVELTSGNTGTGLAIVCGIKGYPFVAVISAGNSIERARMMIGLGAEVVLVDQLPDSPPGQVSGADLEEVERVARQIVAERGAFRADQFERQANFNAHYHGTGPEFIAQSGGAIQAFCDFSGTGGTFAGCTRAFKEHDPAIRCHLIEPASAPVLAGLPVTSPHHSIQGGGYMRAPLTMLRPDDIDGFLQVTDDEVRSAVHRLAREEGIFAGYSSGANLAGALQLLAGPCRGMTIAIMICDTGLKYLSTDLWPETP